MSIDPPKTQLIARTLHVAKRKPLASQAVWRPIDVNDRFLSKGDPENLLSSGVGLLHPLHDLVDGLQARLAKGVDLGTGDVAEVDCSSDTVRNMLRLAEPLVRLQESAVDELRTLDYNPVNEDLPFTQDDPATVLCGRAMMRQ